jgi:branched-chain amino acid aminotransferase
MKDGKIRIFRPDLNAQRLRKSCIATAMQFPTEEMFMKSLETVVLDNHEYIPPYGSNGSLYIRPFVFGSGAKLGLDPSDEYQFIIMVFPVGDYYKGGMGSPVSALIKYGFDRAAPYGQGNVKLGGNYAPALLPTQKSKSRGFPIMLFLDARSHTCIEEFSTSNFAALTKPNERGERSYITPKSKSILASVTNRSLMEVAEREFGWKSERRVIKWDEVLKGGFDEVAACGTAVIITPIKDITRELIKSAIKSRILAEHNMENDNVDDSDMIFDDEEFGDEDFDMEKAKLSGKSDAFKMLYDAYRGIQTGELKGWEEYGWMWPHEGLSVV